MGLKFRKSIKIAPGVRMNLSSKSTGISVGGKGYRYTINSSGRRTASVGIPGTGLSYSKSTKKGTKRKKTTTSSFEKWQKEQEKIHQLNRAQEEVAFHEELVNDLISLHLYSDDIIDWKHLSMIPKPFELGCSGPMEKQAREAYENFQPSFFDKLFKRTESKKKRLRDQIEINIGEDKKAFESWQETNIISNNVLDGNLDSYEEVIQEFDPLGDLTEYGSGFNIGLVDSKTMEVDFQINYESIVPNESKKITSTGKVSTKKLSMTAYYEIVQDFVCSAVLRVALDIFATLPVEKVVLHVLENRIDDSTGHNEEISILSTEIDRTTLYALNLDSIDPSNSMTNFNTRMSFLKTKGFKPIERIEL